MIDINATLIAQILNFLILAGILRAFAYKPVVRMLKARQDRIQESLDKADADVAEADKILAFLTASAGLGDEHVSWCHDLAIIRLYRAFESLMLDTLVGALNNDTSTLSTRI